MDGSFSAAETNAGAAAVIRSDTREEAYARDRARCAKLGGKRDQFPDGVSGAALSHTFAMDNNDAEAVAVLTALAAIPTGAHASVHVVSDSKSTEASIKKFIGTRNRRSVEDMSLRAPMAAIHDILRGGSKTLTLRHVEGHQPPSASQDAHGNNTADEAAERLRVRIPAGPRESMTLWHCDAMTFVPNLWVLNQHITGSVKEAVKATLRKATTQETLRQDSSQSAAARSFRVDPSRVATAPPPGSSRSAAALAHDAKAAGEEENSSAEAFYAMAWDIGRRIRGAQKGRDPLDGAAQRWFTRLVSGTLYTLSMIEDKCLKKPDSREEDSNKLVKSVPGMGFVSSGWTERPSGLATGGTTRTWSTVCPLCEAAGDPLARKDTQDHFTSCPQHEEDWKIAIGKAIDRAVALAPADWWSAPGPRQLQLCSKVARALAEHIQNDEAHYTHRCGFFSAAHANRSIKAVYEREGVDDKPPSTTKMFKNLRLELVRSASALFTKRLGRIEAIGVGRKRLANTQSSPPPSPQITRPFFTV